MISLKTEMQYMKELTACWGIIDNYKREIERLKSEYTLELDKLSSRNYELRMKLSAADTTVEKLQSMFLTAVEFGAIPPYSLEELRKQYEALDLTQGDQQ